MPARRPVDRGALRVRAYPVLAAAVESGIAYGWNRAHKHTDKPSPDAIKDEIERAVMSAICEAFEFEPEQ